MPQEYRFNPNWMDQTPNEEPFRPEDYPVPQGDVDPNVGPLDQMLEPPPADMGGPTVPGDALSQAMISSGDLAGPSLPYPVGGRAQDEYDPRMGTPGTMTIQRQGGEPVTYFPEHVKLPTISDEYRNQMEAWQEKRSAFLEEQRLKNEAWQMAQQFKADKELEVAYTKARRLQGKLAFASAVKSGMPVEQAVSRYSNLMDDNGDMVKNTIAAQQFASKQRESELLRKRDFGPPQSQVIGGRVFSKGGGIEPQWSNLPPTEAAEKPLVQEERTVGTSNDAKARIDMFQLAAIKEELTFKMDKKKRASLEQEKADIEARLSELRNIPSVSSVKRTRAGSVASQSEFDALPSGTTYIGKDGKTYKKP